MRKFVILIAIILALLPVAVYALTPPTSISVQSVRAFQNVATAGDMAIIFHYKITYTPYPTTPADKTFIFRLYADNGTLLATSTPYVFSFFSTKGYGDGVSSFYFTVQPSWEEAFIINILGVPAYYEPIQISNYTMSLSDYSSAVDTTDAQADLYNYIIGICNDFISIYADVPLKATTDTGTILSDYGEAYFRATVPGIQAMSSQLFFVQAYVPEQMPVTSYNMSLQTQYSTRLQGTDIMRGANRLGVKLGGISGAFVLGIVVLGTCIGTGVWTQRKGWPIELAMFVCVGIVILAALLIGDWAFTLAMIIGLVAGIGIMYIFFLKRA